jgi:hypothetical protein
MPPVQNSQFCGPEDAEVLRVVLSRGTDSEELKQRRGSAVSRKVGRLAHPGAQGSARSQASALDFDTDGI